MPFVCRVSISAPEPDIGGVTQMADALAEAVRSGWLEPGLIHGPDDVAGDDAGLAGPVLDYRVFVYPGGADVVVVLDSADLTQASIAVAGLTRHLTTWSPGLLACSADETSITKIDQPHEDGTWLPPIAGSADGPQRPLRQLAELLDEQLQETAALYLLACGIRSIWHPTDPQLGMLADDIIAGAAEEPWGGCLTRALGALLVRAARFEQANGSAATMLVRGSGDPSLAADLLRRARQTSVCGRSGGWVEDEMRGHVLMEQFVTDHDLLWNLISDREPLTQISDRRRRQITTLLWAGLSALATMALPLKGLSGPWQVLDELGRDALVAILAGNEQTRHELEIDDDDAALRDAAAAHTLVWLAIRHPECLDLPAIDSLVDRAVTSPTALRHIVHETLMLAGGDCLRAALAQQPHLAGPGQGYADLAAALEAIDSDPGQDLSSDLHDDMHTALEKILEESDDPAAAVRCVLPVIGLAARLITIQAVGYGEAGGGVASPGTLVGYLLSDPAHSAALLLHRDGDHGEAIRSRMLSLAAQVDPSIVGDLAADLPNLTGNDPRLEPAARSRARSWVHNALGLARHLCQAPVVPAGASPDARAYLTAVQTGTVPDDWPVRRVVRAAAEVAALILDSINAAESSDEVYVSR